MEKSDESRTRRDEQRKKYSEMDKRAKYKLVRSPGEWRRTGCRKRSSLKNWKGREEGEQPRKRWKEEAERDLQVLGVRRWRELVGDREKWKGIA